MNDFKEYRGYCEATYGDVMHFGILGMKWGVRRYQNPDGTLTAAGKKRLKQGDKVLSKVANSKTMNKMSSKMTDYVVKGMQEKSSKEDEELNGIGKLKDYKNSDGTLNETGKERLRSLNEDYAYYQHIKKSMEDSERSMSGKFSDEENEYLSPSQKAFMKYISKSPTFNALYKVSNNMSKSIMEQYKNNVDSKLKEFENRGITLKEIDKMRPLYMSDEYVKRVFKQFELSDELKHFGII